MIRVCDALRQCGHGSLDTQIFHEAIVDVFHSMYRNVSPDEMLCQEGEPRNSSQESGRHSEPPICHTP